MRDVHKDSDAFEAWKPIPDAPGYDASTLGQVRSRRPKNGVGCLVDEPRLLRPTVNKDGYYQVTIFRKSRLVQRLVLEAHVGPCPPGMEARHVIVNDKLDNRLSNLAWGTDQDNVDDRERHGTTARGDRSGARTKPERRARGDRSGARLHPERIRRGASHPRVRFSDREVALLTSMARAGFSRRAMTLVFKISYSHARRFALGQARAPFPEHAATFGGC